jgi:hypothetical protein
VLELRKAGSAGSEKGVLPVLRGGSVVATLRSSNWQEAATVELVVSRRNNAAVAGSASAAVIGGSS